jgi:hypothetical protein
MYGTFLPSYVIEYVLSCSAEYQTATEHRLPTNGLYFETKRNVYWPLLVAISDPSATRLITRLNSQETHAVDRSYLGETSSATYIVWVMQTWRNVQTRLMYRQQHRATCTIRQLSQSWCFGMDVMKLINFSRCLKKVKVYRDSPLCMSVRLPASMFYIRNYWMHFV